ncbi:MAG: hypothetical protein H0T46_33440 [Deltaproteobacteria bacterium]|nr:hypothetical protein [Deltaproteobacteria bacterium]
MTMADLGPERPGEGSETRQWGERSRTNQEMEASVSTRFFFIAVVVIIAALLVYFIVRG